MRSGDLDLVDTQRAASMNVSPSDLRSTPSLEIVTTPPAEGETMPEEVVSPTTTAITTPPSTRTAPDVQARVAEKHAEAAAAAPATTAPTSMKGSEAGGAPAAEPKPVAAKDQQAATAKGISETEKKAPSAAKAKGEKKEEGEEAEEAAPPSPYEAIGPAIQAVNKRTRGLAKHSAPTVLVASAQRAALNKDTEQTRSAATQTVVNIDKEKENTKNVQREEFKKSLERAIEAATPKPETESQAEKVMKTGAKDASAVMSGQMASQRDAAVGPLKTVADKEAAPSDQPAPEARSLEQEPLGKPPEPVSPEAVVPAPLPAKRLDYSSDREPTEKIGRAHV
jgi:hypothetical protein